MKVAFWAAVMLPGARLPRTHGAVKPQFEHSVITGSLPNQFPELFGLPCNDFNMAATAGS